MNVIFIMMREMKCLLSGNNIRNKNFSRQLAQETYRERTKRKWTDLILSEKKKTGKRKRL